MFTKPTFILQVATNLLIRMHTEDTLVHIIWDAPAAGWLFTTIDPAFKMWLRQQLRRIFFVERNSDPSRIDPLPVTINHCNISGPRT